MAGISKAERARRGREPYVPTKKRVRSKKPTAEEIRVAQHDVALLMMAAEVKADKRRMAAVDEYLVRAAAVAAGGVGVG